MPVRAITTYLEELRQTASTPNPTEPSYSAALKRLLEAVAVDYHRPVADVTLWPGKVVGAGAPDVAVYGPSIGELIGYLETKDLGKDLDHLTGHDANQFKRYLAAFPAWIYTNYLEFRFYENGREVKRASLCSKTQIKGSANLQSIAQQKATAVGSLIDQFLQQSVPEIADTRRLAILLAHKARLLETALLRLLFGPPRDPQLASQLDSYRKWLMPKLTETEFADLYAQTITYGLFFAAYESSQKLPVVSFERHQIIQLLPATTKPVRALFQLLAGQFLPSELEWIVDDIVRLLKKADMCAIAVQFAEGTADPTIHFYETFLQQYDPEIRDQRGAYYTPDQVVSYITRSVDCLLKRPDVFDKADGLADPNVTLLDPALGTGTFLLHAIQQVARNFGSQRKDEVPAHLREHTLKNFYAFEFMAAPYVLAHLKLEQTLTAMGVTDGDVQIFLTNTLEDHDIPATLPGGGLELELSEDAKAAQKVKGKEKILIVVGNPPYKGESSNKYDKVEDYKLIDGVSIGERNPKWLQNDYMKFIRWAEWKIAEANQGSFGNGIVAFITDNSYLTSPTFRGMRKHLLDRFSHIYLMNLHGRKIPPEHPPQGIPADDGVFDIVQGTAIMLLARKPEHHGMGQVFYYDFWGDRQTKYDYLKTHDVDSTQWTPLAPFAPKYFFAERKPSSLAPDYDKWADVRELFPLSSMGIVSARDKSGMPIRWSVTDMWETLNDFILLDAESAREKYDLGKDVRDWGVVRAQDDVRDTGPTEKYVKPICYRPFDIRHTYYTGVTAGFLCNPRREVMQHMGRKDNLALVTFRHTRTNTLMRAFVTREMVDARLLSGEANCFALPLYKYTPNVVDNQTTLDTTNGMGREPNFPPMLLTKLSTQYSSEENQIDVTPEEVFYYIYGVLNATEYQTEFEALQEEAPRIPFTVDYDTFIEMSERGQRLTSLHLLEANDLKGLSNLVVSFHGTGLDKVERGYPQFNNMQQRVYINPGQYFDGVTTDMWNYCIGNYQPLSKYLEVRRGRALIASERRNYETFATAIDKILGELAEVNATWQSILNGSWFNPLTPTP